MPVPTHLAHRSLPRWTAIWLLAGVLHLTQAIWLSGGTAIPADLADGRFNQLVLEHGYQSLRGHYEWQSPGQFHPIAHTLGWSDTHLGTLPAYGLFRIIGLGPERSGQLWFIGCAILNMILGARLLRTLGVDPRLLGPITFGAFAGAPTVWLASTHPQILPIFPALWAGVQWVEFSRDHLRARLFVVAGALAWQFAAGPYLAFFATGVVALGGLAFLVSGTQVPSPPTAPKPPRQFSFYLAGFGAALGIINLWVYLKTLQSGTERPFSEVINLCPTWQSWFSTSPLNLIYPAAWPGGVSEVNEHALFSGFAPWILTLLAVACGWKHRRNAVARRAGILGFSALAIVVFTVKWPNGFSVWLALAELVEPLRGFRAIGRVVVFTHALMLGASGLLLTSWLASQRGFKISPASAWGISALLALEGLAVRQPHYQIEDAVARRDAVAQAWRDAGDHPILAFAPGFTNQTEAQVNLDAWAAALALQRVTLNGYSGGAPSSHIGFLWTPTAANAHELTQRLNFSASEVSFVTQFPPAVAAKLDYQYFPDRVLQDLEGFDLPSRAWTLFAPPERFEYDEGVFYQFTPHARVSFRVPDTATRITFLIGGRPGSYSNGGDSDGFTLSWSVAQLDESPLSADSEFINPRDSPDHRGFLHRAIPLPPGEDRLLMLAFGPGPSGLNNWDWPLLGRLRVE
jgi:hypothetical protein